MTAFDSWGFIKTSLIASVFQNSPRIDVITYQRDYLAGQTVHEYFTNTRIMLSFVYSWYIRVRFSQPIIDTTCDSRLLQIDTDLLSVFIRLSFSGSQSAQLPRTTGHSLALRGLAGDAATLSLAFALFRSPSQILPKGFGVK